MRKQLLSILPAILLCTGIGSAQTTGSFTFGGKVRDYIVHTPAGLSNAPLVLNLHGLGSNASQQQLYTRFDAIADREGFIVVYPNGAGNTWDITGNTDVDFLVALVDTINAHYGIDRNRVYATGFSMGGYMSHRLGCAAANKFAAIAPVSGLNASYNCSPARPMPVLQIHGTADSTVKYSGVAATISGWVGRDGCPQTAQVTDHYPASNPNSAVRKDYYGPCNQSSEVILLTVNGAGHVWPGGYGASLDINAGEEAWAFFKDHRLSTVTISPAAKPSEGRMSISASYDAGILLLRNGQDVRRVRVIDARGSVVASWTIGATIHQSRPLSLPIHSIPAGLYVVAVDTQERNDAVMLMVP